MRNEQESRAHAVGPALRVASAVKAPWFRVPRGWALNLDGSNASLVNSLPRVEVRFVPAGWIGEYFFADGSRAVLAPPYPGGAAAIMVETLEWARRLLLAPLLASAPAE